MTRWFGSRLAGDPLREAAWVARCVGRPDAAPLTDADLGALASSLSLRELPGGAVLFNAGQAPTGVWIVRSGAVALTAGPGRRPVVVLVLRPGDVEGDVPLILDCPPVYTARAIEQTTCLFLDASSFHRLLLEHPALSRRWLSTCTTRLAQSHARILQLLRPALSEQVANLLLCDATDGRVSLPQVTLAAMLGVHRQSLNKVLKSFERAGLVEVSRMEVRIAEPARLEHIAWGLQGHVANP